ncbi:serum amyloid P-component-like [Neoarius graeffei]|uniref:serum amyloid P-component-like n=1 Tax=Neoarius graeffei TaxID=443677 RepID=UPI00298C899F|nr:serum amyloid P-component-like [Neoarius graeffei]
MARILIFFCVFALNSNKAHAYWMTTKAPTLPPVTTEPTWETKNLGGWMFSIMPNSVVRFRSAALSNVTGITLCLRALTEKNGFSDNTLLLTFGENAAVCIRDYSVYYQLQVAGSFTNFYIRSMVPVQTSASLWRSRCLTWDSSSGMAQLWTDGMMSIRKGLSRGTVFSGKAELIFQIEGQVSNIYMWDSVLSIRQLHKYLYHHSVPSQGSVLDWTQMEFSASGYVVLEPAYPKRLHAGPAKRNKKKRMKTLKKRLRQEV